MLGTVAPAPTSTPVLSPVFAVAVIVPWFFRPPATLTVWPVPPI